MSLSRGMSLITFAWLHLILQVEGFLPSMTPDERHLQPTSHLEKQADNTNKRKRSLSQPMQPKNVETVFTDQQNIYAAKHSLKSQEQSQ